MNIYIIFRLALKPCWLFLSILCTTGPLMPTHHYYLRHFFFKKNDTVHEKKIWVIYLI